MTGIRTRAQRIADTKRRLTEDIDLWVASADPEAGAPYLIPLSHYWDGSTILISTPRASATGSNLERSGTVRLGLGTTRDVVLIEGTVETISEDEIESTVADRFATKAGFDPRQSGPEYGYYRITPVRIQAWHEEPELAGRTIMTDGRWKEG